MNDDKSIKTLNLYPIDYPFETLVSKMKMDKPKLILDPDFQRKYKWDKEGWARASKFIESCLMRIPLPSCYLAEDKEGRHIVIDGVQRLTTILKFFDDQFPLEGLTTYKELDGKKFSEIGDFKTELETTTIRCIVLRKDNPQLLVREIFSRLNQGAVTLEAQEIRHALYPGKFDSLLTSLAEKEEIKNFAKGPKSEAKRDSREAEEQVLRYFALGNDLSLYGDRLSKYLDEFMESKQKITDSEIDAMRNSFCLSLGNCISIFGTEVFKDTTRPGTRQSMVYYDLLMRSLGAIDESMIINKSKEIKAAFFELCKSSAFKRTTSSGLQNKASIIRRREIWAEILNRHLK